MARATLALTAGIAMAVTALAGCGGSGTTAPDASSSGAGTTDASARAAAARCPAIAGARTFTFRFTNSMSAPISVRALWPATGCAAKEPETGYSGAGTPRVLSMDIPAGQSVERTLQYKPTTSAGTGRGFGLRFLTSTKETIVIAKTQGSLVAVSPWCQPGADPGPACDGFSIRSPSNRPGTRLNEGAFPLAIPGGPPARLVFSSKAGVMSMTISPS